MSYKPNAFAGFSPTGWVAPGNSYSLRPFGGVTFSPPELSRNQAYVAAWLSSSPHQNIVVVPARAAYSHSDSLGRRYAWPVLLLSHATYACASFQLTHTTGSRSVCVNPGDCQLNVGSLSHLPRPWPQTLPGECPVSRTKAAYSPRVTSYLPSANDGTVTSCCGASSATDPSEPP